MKWCWEIALKYFRKKERERERKRLTKYHNPSVIVESGLHYKRSIEYSHSLKKYV